MSTPRLPLELQLYILDLAIPPPGFYRSLERALLCKRLALVHRDWTARAQYHLAEYLTFEVGENSPALEKRLSRFEQVVDSGTKRICIWTSRDAAEQFDVVAAILWGAPDLEELSIRRCWTRVDGGRDYRMLTDYPNDWTSLSLPATCPLPYHLPDRLRFLSIAHASLDDTHVAEIARLPSLDVLLLTHTLFPTHTFRDFSFPTCRIRVLGIKCPAVYFPSRCFPTLSHTIKRIAIAGSNPDRFIGITPAGLHIQPTLESIDVFTSPITPETDRASVESHTAAVSVSCRTAGVSLKVVHFEEQQQMDEFDLEEWATSVGRTGD